MMGVMHDAPALGLEVDDLPLLACKGTHGLGPEPRLCLSFSPLSGSRATSTAFALQDMVGDGKPELCTLHADPMTVRCVTSDSGTTTAITATFSQSGGVFL